MTQTGASPLTKSCKKWKRGFTPFIPFFPKVDPPFGVCLIVSSTVFWPEVILVKLWKSWIERHLPSVVVIPCVLQSTMLPGINCTFNSCFLLCCNMVVRKKNAKDFGVKWRGIWILALPPASYITLCHLTFFVCKMENKKPILHLYWKNF